MRAGRVSTREAAPAEAGRWGRRKQAAHGGSHRHWAQACMQGCEQHMGSPHSRKIPRAAPGL